MAFQQDAQVGDFGQVLRRYRRDEEPPLLRCLNEPFARQPAQGLPQRRQARRVARLQAIELEVRTGLKVAEYDVPA